MSTSVATNPKSELISPAHPPRLKILFTEGASLSARQTLYPIGPLHDIDVIDPDPLCQCRFSSFVRRYTRSPSFTKQPAEFLRFLAQLVRERHYDVIFPTHEQVYLLSRFRDAFTPHVGLALPEFASMERMQNKAEFSRLLMELGLPQPESIIVRTKADLNRSWQYPFYLKLAYGTAGGGVFKIENRTELDQKVAELQAQGRFDGRGEAVVQQPAQGVLCSVQAVFNQGEVIGIHCFEARRLGVGGMSTARTSADHPLVREHVARLGRFLHWHGALFIDYFYDRSTARPEYIECNPRIGETVNAWLAGVNLPQLLVQVSHGESPPPALPSRVGVRTHNLFMILMSAAYDGGSRGDLLHEIGECRRGTGLYEGGEDTITRPKEDPLSRLPFAWVTSQLLAWPGIAKRFVTKTVKNYSLPESATEAIKALPLNLANDAF